MEDRSGRWKTRCRRGYALLALTGAFIAAGVSLAAESREDRPERAAAARLRAPVLLSPADGASAQALPGFSWRRVRGAAKYEFQLSADARFRSTLASFDTGNTSATVDDTVFDGTYYWRVRAVNASRTAGRWSAVRKAQKRWSERPQLLSPAADATITYPTTPLVLSWSAARHAVKYEVVISADPTLAGNVVGNAGKPFETSATNLAVPGALSPGRYYWAVTPMDAGGLKGPSSATGSFVWSWPSKTKTRVTDLWGGDDSMVDAQFSWDPVPGAARYEIEISVDDQFAPGSKMCCTDPTTGTSLSPTRLLPNNTDIPGGELGYHWRVRAIDLDGNAGEWNLGPRFRKVFDDAVPSIPNLRIRDHTGATVSPLVPTSGPIVDWDPVPGASSYEVRVVPWVGGCNWSAGDGESWGGLLPIEASGTAWTPLANLGASPVPFATPAAEFDKLADGGSYCARVRARAGTDTTNKRVVSDWTVLGGSEPAFTYDEPVTSGMPAPLVPAQYREPVTGVTLGSMPLFTWDAVPNACGYFVAVARDQNFTTIVDVARTKIPAYAPRLRTYADETTSYYWAVMPMSKDGLNRCSVTTTAATANSPRTFRKLSSPPRLETPLPGETVASQPTFRWTWTGSWPERSGLPDTPATEAAREYQLQVATDDTFANPIDNVKTTSTAYTSSSTYPADTAIYWRVRANDENGTGLRWSETRVFRRTLPIPEAKPSDPPRGETFPVFSWSPVPGAVSYDFHVEEEDGDKRDWTFRTTAASFTTLYGLGVFRWQVRANFPRLPFGTVQSGWSPVQTFTRFIDPPAGVGLRSDRTRVLLSWDPSVAAKRYRVDFSETNTFNQVIDSHMTSNPNYAPRMNQPGFANGGLLHWRIAALDEGNNVGGFAMGSVRLPRGMRVTALGALTKRRRAIVTVIVTQMNGQPLKRATVVGRGAGSRPVRRRTNRRGMARVRIRPRRAGNVTFTVRKRGYRAGKAALPVG